MAKHSAVKTGGPARIRLVVLDAEIPDGDLGSLTQALQNALRSPTGTATQHRVSTTNGSKTISHQPASQDEEVEADTTAEESEEVTTILRQPRAKRAAPRVPQVVDIDMNAPVSLATFAQGKDSKSQNKKFMIAAAWLKEHRDINAVAADHIYTCFKSMGWSTNITDFGLPLRDLKNKYRYLGKSGEGYQINHIGLDYVKKLGGGGDGVD